MIPSSLPGVADVELLRGPAADENAPPDVLVEVPHGASTRAHYDALRERLASPLPEDLHAFFHVNTDVGAWDYGREVARRLIAARPTRAALVVRCLVPRTFVDTNRVVGAATGDLTQGGITGAIPPYVTAPADHALLVGLHAAYTALAERAWALVAGHGGFGLMPHTYMPRSLGISRVDADIVRHLRAAHEPARYAACPLRAEVDLITRTEAGAELAPPGLAERLSALYAEVGLQTVEGDSYTLHPATMGRVWSERYPAQALCLEIRRDLLVERWIPFEEQRVDAARVARAAGPLATAIHGWLAARGR